MFIEIPAGLQSIMSRGSIYGVAVNDAKYMISTTSKGKKVQCPFYVKWFSMLSRCYNEKTQEKQPCYVGCVVCDDWLIFSNFKSWMIKQDWEGMQLDKDLLIPGSKLYSPDTCLFIPQKINKLLTDRAGKRGFLPQGVTYISGNFIVQISINGKKTTNSYHDWISEAEAEYMRIKQIALITAANTQPKKIKDAIIGHAKYLLEKPVDILFAAWCEDPNFDELFDEGDLH